MLTEFARNTRKQNLAVLAAKQEEAVGSDNDTLRNFVGGAFLGRMDDEQAAARALGLVQIPTGVGYEQALLDLPRPTDEAEDVPDTATSSCSPVVRFWWWPGSSGEARRLL